LSITTIHLPRDFKEFLKLLDAHHVEYLKHNKKAARPQRIALLLACRLPFLYSSA